MVLPSMTLAKQLQTQARELKKSIIYPSSRVKPEAKEEQRKLYEQLTAIRAHLKAMKIPKLHIP